MTVERATHQPKVGVAWQKLLRDRRERESGDGFWKDLDLDLGRARVRPIERLVAERVIREYEWLGTVGVANLFYGVFFGDYCGGALCFQIGSGGGCGGHQFKMFGIQRDELAYLARGACAFWTPKGTASKLISIAIRLLAKERPRVRVVVAYADTEAGEIGTVYQATNWTCLGFSSTVEEFVAPGGRVYNVRRIWKDYQRSAAFRRGEPFEVYRAFLEANGWRSQTSNPKLRYCYPVRDREAILARIAPMVVPYPKREASVV